MTDDLQTIDDLIKSSKSGVVDEDSVQGKFDKKYKTIKINKIEDLAKQKAASLGVNYINLYGNIIPSEAIALIKEEEAKELGAICFYYDEKDIRLGAIDVEDFRVKEKLDELVEEYKVKGDIYLITQRSFDYAFEVYKNLSTVKKSGGVEITGEDLEKFGEEIDDYKKLNDKINDINVSDVVTLILATAIKTRSSDVHIEAEEFEIVVRLRIDGVLQEAARIEKDKWKKIISRMKVIAKVKINVEGVPQDGRFSIFFTDEKLDVRTSFLPTAFGESVVMRLLRSGSIGVEFDDLGLSPYAKKKLEVEITKPNGLILTTGPTGSGKTTSLYAVLNKLNQSGTKIITLEDPIEYQLKGINQSQINESKGYSFANGLRSILRQDPDIVMVGEIRDFDTAEIAVQASLTGHLVLSTLHTNDSAGVIPRLIDMGVKPFFIVPSINAVIAQRLIRKLCPECREEHTVEGEDSEKVKKILATISSKSGAKVPENPKFFKAGKGCKKCAGVGYKGRIGIYEIFTMTDDLKQLTMDNAPSFKILHKAIENGMVTMLQDGVLKCADGVSSIEEVFRVIGKFDYIDEIYGRIGNSK